MKRRRAVSYTHLDVYKRQAQRAFDLLQMLHRGGAFFVPEDQGIVGRYRNQVILKGKEVVDVTFVPGKGGGVRCV